jgi:N-acetyl-D-muramate 6-phosphate phosphatase
MTTTNIDCVLFDLDGTLVDTAPDLINALNQSLQSLNLKPLDSNSAKPYISKGAAAMIDHALGNEKATDTELKNIIRDGMLSRYENNIAVYSRVYSGMPETLAAIEMFDIKWGVVTNKLQRFTLPLMQALKLTNRAACIISGDTTAHCKPHPAPILAACTKVGVKPENCVYIGDAAHDILAGKNANMKTLAALYGYLQADDQPENWGADGLLEHPQQLLQWLRI